MSKGANLRNAAWNEPRIFDGVDANKMSANWAEIRENDRLIDAYCEKHGLDREAIRSDLDATIAKARKEGL